MNDQVLVSCFTDLKGSTSLTEELGQDIYIPYLLDHFSVAEMLANCLREYMSKPLATQIWPPSRQLDARSVLHCSYRNFMQNSPASRDRPLSSV